MLDYISTPGVYNKVSYKQLIWPLECNVDDLKNVAIWSY